MDYTEIAKEVLTKLGGFSVIVAAIAWVIKSLFTQLLAKDITRFQQDLQSTSERQLEEMRSQCQTLLHEQTVRFDYLHKRRADFIADLHQRLCKAKFDADLWGGFKTMGQDDPVVLDLYNDAIKNWQALSDCSTQNSLYLPKKLAEKIDRIISPVIGPLIAIKSSESDKKNEIFRERWRNIEKEIPSILEEIEIEFRKLLGTE